jgi:predicted signal transduction protein with EAL and GGDEF domain
VHPAQLMKNADLALYRSKHDGRGAWRFFEPAMDEVARTRRELEKDLRRTLKLGELGVHYQPLVDSRDRNLIGFEALVRWHHPTRGMVAPTEFISVAEEVGLIGEIGTWVLQTACAEATSWPPHLRVAVNLSTRQFRGGSLVTTVADALEISGLNPSRLELEITESVPLQQDQATLSTLQELHKLGTRIALDDFGTGYSSLSYLRGFPFDKIKIDRSFVSDLPHSEEAVAIVRGILGLAANLHLNVTAEGVETEAQCEFLAAAGCTEIQGYLISMPVPAREVPALIKSLSGQTEMANPLLIGSRP